MIGLIFKYRDNYNILTDCALEQKLHYVPDLFGLTHLSIKLRRAKLLFILLHIMITVIPPEEVLTAYLGFSLFMLPNKTIFSTCVS